MIFTAFVTISVLAAVNVTFLAAWKFVGFRTRNICRNLPVLRGNDLAVILVDMQSDYVKELPNEETDRILPYQLSVLERCRHLDIPVIKFEVPKYGETLPVLQKKFEQVPRNVSIYKSCDSGFSNDATDDFLDRYGIRRLFLMGINSDYCVMATARDGLMLGYQIMTSRDVISTHTEGGVDMNWYRGYTTVIDL